MGFNTEPTGYAKTILSDARAAHCRAVLPIPRERAAELGRTAVDITVAGPIEMPWVTVSICRMR